MISIIIPTFNEEASLPQLLDSLISSSINTEIIIVDGGSHDKTLEIASSYNTVKNPIVILNSQLGRGHQMRLGADAANGEILLFLHADSEILPQAILAIENVMSTNSKLIGGNFRINFEGTNNFCRFMNYLYHLIRKLGFYYGDSGIFIRKKVYFDLGGFRLLAIMEDYDLVRKMERYGKTCCLDKPVLTTSGRRFVGKTPIQMFYLWGKMHLLFALGASSLELQKNYYGEQYEPKP